MASWVTIGGNSLLDATVSSNAATFYVVMEPFELRQDESTSQDAIVAHLRAEFATIQEGVAFVFVPPALMTGSNPIRWNTDPPVASLIVGLPVVFRAECCALVIGGLYRSAARISPNRKNDCREREI